MRIILMKKHEDILSNNKKMKPLLKNRKSIFCNYDKRLAKYACHLNNPKYYKKIFDILYKAEKAKYQFQDFNKFDMEKILIEILSYWEAIKTPEENKKMIRYYNKDWFVISDKHYILCFSPSFFDSLDFYIRAYLCLFAARIKQLFLTDRYIDVANVNQNLYLIQGAIKVAEFLETDINNLTEYFL